MRIVVLHAEGDLASDEIVAAVRSDEILRFSIGRRPVALSLRSVQVVLVWSAAAAKLGWSHFAPLVQGVARGVVVVVGGVEAPAEAQAFHLVRWDRNGATRLAGVLHASGEAAETGNGALNGLAKGAAAGLAAAVGVLAAGSSPVVNAAPIAVSRREEQARSGSAEAPAQTPARREAPAPATIAAVQLSGDSGPGATSTAAAALAQELVQSNTISIPQHKANPHAKGLPKLLNFNL